MLLSLTIFHQNQIQPRDFHVENLEYQPNENNSMTLDLRLNNLQNFLQKTHYSKQYFQYLLPEVIIK